MDEAGEKLKRAFTGAFALLFAVIVLCAVFCNQNVFGTQSPRSLLAGGLALAVGVLCAAWLLRLLPAPGKRLRRTLLAAFFTLCFLAQAHVGRALVVGATGDWDFGIVLRAALDFAADGAQGGIYFNNFPNNQPLMLLLAGLFRLLRACGVTEEYELLVWGMRFGAVLLQLALFFLYLCAARLLGRRAGALALLLGAATAPFLLYAPVYYTDTVTAPIPIAILYCWLRLRAARREGRPGRGPLAAVFVLGVLGTLLKVTVVIMVIAVVPIIKKFLYSDHEIFLRELVSNAVDATQKLKTLASVGEFKGELGDLTVHVSFDSNTIKISDRGIGMTAEEIDKYINQIAFSGAEEFVEKYKNDAAAIIGHFGLGFYSSFMVSKKVEIVTKSYKEGAVPMKWSCDGTPEYTLEETEKEDRGTDIILYIDDENKDFLNKDKINSLLTKYCRYLPVPIAFGKKQEWKDGKYVDTDEDNIINDIQPAWVRKPTDMTDEDYKKFYQDLYPMSDEPLFWIHLNVDYPFHLTGILYFPRIKSNIDLHRNKIQLYCNQVFVTDSVEGIVPEFLTLLHGVLDSPDIPLNVSRSYLQSDQNVKKISNHIMKKVADRLEEMFKNDRPQFEEKWDSLKLFIQYGMLSEEKFYDRAAKFALLKDVDGKYYTFEEYKALTEANQTDKEGNLIYLYTTNANDQYSYIQAAKDKAYSVLIMDGQLDVHAISQMEQKFEKTRFVRVDSDTIDNLIRKDNVNKVTLNEDEKNALQEMFKSQLPKIEKTDFIVTFEALGENSNPVMLTQSEYMRRMREMSAMQPGMSFYGELPDNYNLVLNTDHELVKKILSEEEAACAEKLNPILSDLKGWKARQSDLREAQSKKKEEEITSEEKEDMTNTNKKIDELVEQRNSILSEYAGGNKLVSQLIDLALLANGMLKGEALSQFIKRSVQMIG